MMPIFPIKLILLAFPVLIVGALLAAVAGRGLGMLKKQGVAWVLTIVMVFAAINIGYAKAPFNNPKPESVPAPTKPPAASVAPPSDPVASVAPTASVVPPNTPVASAAPPAFTDSFVWDDANVLSDRTVRELDERNDRLWNNYYVTIGVVTCNYGGDDLDSFALECAENMGLGGYDFIVALDISGDNYWLIQGADLVWDFSDQTASDYAYDYMESSFARGDYDDAVLGLTKALEEWYGVYYF